jgi:peptidoglycan/xylan/chitin deacetylase (PgdA/CDA1 family)
MVKRFLKRVIYFLIYYSGALNALILVFSRLKKQHCTAILFYHRFSENSYGDCELPHLKIGEFEKQVRHVKKCYKIITMDELADRLALNKKNESPCVAITIDDGYLNSYKLAYPVLKRLNLPATIYLAAAFIGTTNSTWVDELMDIFLLSKNKFISFQKVFGEEVMDLSNQKGKIETFRRFFKRMLYVEHEKKESLLQELAKILGVEEESRNQSERKMLNWDEVVEMSRDNISFGAHTMIHPTLSKMETAEAKREILESKNDIETKLGGKAKHFAIPNGKLADFSEELKQYCKEIGFVTVASTEPGVVCSGSDPYFLNRISPRPPIYSFACELARYMFFNRTK